MRQNPYASDLTDQEWAIWKPLIPPAKPGGRPRTTDMREVLNAIFYVLKTGCQWNIGNVQDRDGAIWLLLTIAQYLPRLQKIWADAAYRGKFVDWVKLYLDIVVEIVTRDAQAEGFQLLSWRWIVERTFAWFYNYRRLSKDYEYHLQSSEAMIYAAMSHLMVRRLAKLEAPT